MKAFVTFWIFALIAMKSTYSQNVTKCFYCESQQGPGCVDPFDTTIGTSLNCDEFVNSIEESISHGGSTRAVSFSRAFAAEKTVPGIKREYRCVKTTVTHVADNSNELYRLCVPLEPTVDSACSYLKQLASEKVVMKTCTECNKDNCNGSSYIALSLWSVLAFLLAKVF